MNKKFWILIYWIFAVVHVNAGEPASSPSSTVLYMDSPAASWYEATPIGNGRLGGMVYGGIAQDTIKTNEDTFWSGEPRDLQRPDAHRFLPEIRQLLLADNHVEAQQLIDGNLLGPNNQSYMPLADIALDWSMEGDVTNYRRELDLNRGVVTITYAQGGVNYTREVFASFPDQVIVMRITADRPGAISFAAGLSSQINHQIRVEGKQIIINGQAPVHVEPNYMGFYLPVYRVGEGMRFEGRLLVKHTHGKLGVANGHLQLEGASSATLIFSAATSFNGFDKDPFKEGKDERAISKRYLRKAARKSVEALRQAHLADYSALFGRVDIDFGHSARADWPINKRVEAYKPGTDPALTALYFQFGRYLLISASREGSQPANLAGIWNQDMQPAWSANWTINCNAQLNYYAAEAINLSECHPPLFQLIRETSVDGAKTARNLYNARGWMAHHNLDLWRTTWPVGGTGHWALFQVGGAWLCQHIWEHYLFTLDKSFLAQHYDLMKNAALFYLDHLQEDQNGYLVTNPSESFENNYRKPSGQVGWAAVGVAQDMQIIRALFENTMSAAAVLGDNDFAGEVAKRYQRLAPMKISPRTGQLQEWNEDWDAADPRNGQVGHGWAFAVGNQITLRGTPDLAEAFRKTIDHRLPGYSYNGGSWAAAFPTIYWARFEEPDSVQRVIDRHFGALFPNLTSQFFNVWQIDGNLGITAGITEALLQSHADELNLLPALPRKYTTGHITGLRARGGYAVDIYWADNKLTKVVITADRALQSETLKVRYAGIVREFDVNKGENIELTGSLEPVAAM